MRRNLIPGSRVNVFVDFIAMNVFSKNYHFRILFAVDICENIFRYKQVTNIINSLAIEAAAPKGTVIERKNLAELMEVARSASDSDIDLVIEMLKRMNSKTI